MTKKELPRGLTYRGNSIIASFALKDGKIARLRVGIVGVTSENECLRRRLEFMKQVDLGTYAAPKPRQKAPKKVSYTVADLWPIYLRNHTNQGKTDGARLTIAWGHLKPLFAHLPIEDVSTGLVEQYVAQRKAAGMANGTINREISCLRAMFKRGTRITPRMVSMMPAFPERLKEAAPRKGFLTDEQFSVMAAQCKPLWLRAFIEAAYRFGFRKSELLNLRVRQVDLVDRWIFLFAEDTKNNSPRKVRMTAEVFQLLTACVRGKEAEEFVFTREPAGSPVLDMRREWADLTAASGLDGLLCHDLRRSAIRNMVRRGVTETVCMRISGHKTRSVFQRYDITDEADLTAATAAIEAGSQVSGSKTVTKTDTSDYAVTQEARKSLN